MIWEAVAALVVGLAAFWVVLEPLLRSTPPAPAPAEPIDPAETPRGVALAALKEIEFDRATGKLSDVDYEALRTRYTAEALEALRADPDGASSAPVRSGGAPDVEDMIAARVRSLRFADAPTPETASTCFTCGPRPEADAVFCSHCGRSLETGTDCVRCGAELAPGSAFCESCGSTVAA